MAEDTAAPMATDTTAAATADTAKKMETAPAAH
jgi:hypothetical protein